MRGKLKKWRYIIIKMTPLVKELLELVITLSAFSGIVVGAVRYLLKPIRITLCKDYLVDFLAEVELGIPKDLTQIKRAFEKYDIYIKDLKQNTYVEERWKEVIGDKKLYDFVREFNNKQVKTIIMKDVIERDK